MTQSATLFKGWKQYLRARGILPAKSVDSNNSSEHGHCFLPPIVHESTQVIELKTASSALVPPVFYIRACPGEIYAGYTEADLKIFDLFAHAEPKPSPGFVTDFIGTRTRTSSLWTAARIFDGQVMRQPIPYDLYETLEWVGLLKAVASASSGRFTMIELGSGHGPWIAAGAVAARLRGAVNIKVMGVEADPGRFELMRQNMADNHIDPSQYKLVCAAVGVDAGRARWPKIHDPANAAGARPVAQSKGQADQADADYMGGGEFEAIDVQIVPLAELISEEPLWDVVHIDVQGWEVKLCAANVELLNARVRWLIIGTHSRLIDGEMIQLLHAAGWSLENEKPTRFRFDQSFKSFEQMTEVDGGQVWRNPRLAPAIRI